MVRYMTLEKPNKIKINYNIKLIVNKLTEHTSQVQNHFSRQ